MFLRCTVRIDPRVEPQSLSTGTVLLARPHCLASSVPARLGSCGDLPFFPDDPSAPAAGALQLQRAFVQGLQASVVADRRRGDAELAALVVESHLRIDVQGARRFVEESEPWPLAEDAQEAQALPLAGGQ